MTNNIDDLAALWRTQTVQEIDITSIKRELHAQRWKQRLYMLVDVFSTIPLAVVLYLKGDKLPAFAYIFTWALLIITVPLVIYLLWLRRHAAFKTAVDTQSYVELLYQQVASNVKIAFYTKYSSWIAAAYLIVVVAYEMISGEKAKLGEDALVRFYSWLGLGLVLIILCYFWARGRERKFKARMEELASIRSQLD